MRPLVPSNGALMVHLQLQLVNLVHRVQKAVATRLKPEDMVGTIFIFSDMEFDEANDKASSPYGGIVSSMVAGKYIVSRQPREEKTNFRSVKVSSPPYAQLLINTCGFY